MTEARMQLDSIDKALDELELTPFPGTDSDWLESMKSVAERELDSEPLERTPPPIPDSLRQHLKQAGRDEDAE